MFSPDQWITIKGYNILIMKKAIRLVRGHSGVETMKIGSEKPEKSFLKQAQEGGESGILIRLLL